MQGRCRYRVHPEEGLEDAPAAAPAGAVQQLAAREPDADGSTDARQAAASCRLRPCTPASSRATRAPMVACERGPRRTPMLLSRAKDLRG